LVVNSIVEFNEMALVTLDVDIGLGAAVSPLMIRE
jgi:hypothetical protein